MFEKVKKQKMINRQGLTLVEMMISLSIFGVVMGVVFGFMVGTRDSYDKTREKVQYQQSVRAVVSLMTREIRSTGCNPNGAAFESFFTADAQSFRCRADLNGDTDITDQSPDEDVSYVFNSGTGELTRNNGFVSYIVLRSLTNVQFIYYDSDGNILAGTPLNSSDRSLIQSIQISIEGETGNEEAVDYRTRVLIRNG